jgi:hypothetical protein
VAFITSFLLLNRFISLFQRSSRPLMSYCSDSQTPINKPKRRQSSIKNVIWQQTNIFEACCLCTFELRLDGVGVGGSS